jgi:hypothetical protein
LAAVVTRIVLLDGVRIERDGVPSPAVYAAKIGDVLLDKPIRARLE